MKISKQSLTYRLINTYGTGMRHIEDSCELITTMVKTILAVATITMLCGIMLGFSLGEILAWLAASYSMGFFIEPSARLIGFGIALVTVTVGVLGVVVTAKLKKRREDRIANKLPAPKIESMVSQVYDRVHNKFCSQIQLVD